MINLLLQNATKNNNTININEIDKLNLTLEEYIRVIKLLEQNEIMILENNSDSLEELMQECKENDIYVGESLIMYLQEITKYPLLTNEEEKNLFQQYINGSESAKNKLICSNLRLVVSIARKYVYRIENKSITLQDLISEGNFGLIEAIKRFDINKKCKLSTYATWLIKFNIMRSILKADMVKLSIESSQLSRKIRYFIDEYYKKNGVKPSIQICSQEFKIPENKILEILNASSQVYSLDSQVYPDKFYCYCEEDEQINTTLMDTIKIYDPRYTLIEADSYIKYVISLVKDILTEKEYQILSYRYGLDGKKRSTLEEIGNIYGITSERIRQYEKRALKKIRNHFGIKLRPQKKSEKKLVFVK